MTDETIGNVPILILGNKIDRPEAISEERLREMFGLYGQTTGKVAQRSRYLSLDLGAHVFSCFLSVRPSGHHSHEGAEHETTGGVHVQRVEAAGLRRRIPLALQLHRVKEPPPPPPSSPPSKEEGGCSTQPLETPTMTTTTTLGSMSGHTSLPLLPEKPVTTWSK